MTKQEQIDIYNELHDKIMNVTKSKSSDYANEDVLSNFKNVSQAAKALGIDVSKPEQYGMFMVILKICRLTNLLNSNKVPNNESIDDSFLDGINYFKLAYCNYKEGKSKGDKVSNVENRKCSTCGNMFSYKNSFNYRCPKCGGYNHAAVKML